MSNVSENKICQNCKKDFTIESDDFLFYEKMKVPAPTFCPHCRFVRRMIWRNERSLYKRKCDMCQKNIIAMYDDKVPFPVYCPECWRSDKWEAGEYTKDYDFSKSFFEQWEPTKFSRLTEKRSMHVCVHDGGSRHSAICASHRYEKKLRCCLYCRKKEKYRYIRFSAETS